MSAGDLVARLGSDEFAFFALVTARGVLGLWSAARSSAGDAAAQRRAAAFRRGREHVGSNRRQRRPGDMVPRRRERRCLDAPGRRGLDAVEGRWRRPFLLLRASDGRANPAAREAGERCSRSRHERPHGPALPAADRAGHRPARRLRDAGPLAARDPRRRLADRVHPDRRGARIDRRLDGLAAKPGLPRRRELAGRHPAGLQRLAAAAARPQPSGDDPCGIGRGRAVGAPAGAGDHRERGGGRPAAGRGPARRAQGAWRAAGAGRFRHRLLQPSPSAGVAVRTRSRSMRASSAR